MEKREHSCTVSDTAVNWYRHHGKQYGDSFKKLGVNLPYDWAIQLWGIHPEKTTILKDTCTLMFIVAIFTIAITWPLQYSCLENPRDGGAWWVAVHGVAEGWTRLSDFTFTFHFHALEKEMTTHSSILAWRIPGMGEPGGLPSMGSHRVGHDWSDLAAAASHCSLQHYLQ